jgi:hypothetical protein
LAGQAKRRGPGPTPPGKWSDWKTALSDISNAALVSEFLQQAQAGQECNLQRRRFMYRVDGRRRLFVTARRNQAYVWQRGRFEGDIAFWQGGLSQADDVRPVDQETCLRFYLTSEKDFEFFHEAVKGSLQSVKWSDDLAAEENYVNEKEEG